MYDEFSFARSIIEGELRHWRVPKTAENVFSDFESLEQVLRSVTDYSGVRLSKDQMRGVRIQTVTWVHRSGRRYEVGYLCLDCNKYIVGPPEINIVQCATPFSGREALEYSCSNCRKKLS